MSTPSARTPSAPIHPTLFDLPLVEGVEPPPTTLPTGRPRLRVANRDQIVFRAAPLDALLPPDHRARLVWDYVQGLDLAPLSAHIKAVEGGPGRAPADPKILLALWLYATLDDVGSARELNRLCTESDPYRWFCGDVSMNYHGLADFRVDHSEVLDRLLTHSVAVLIHEGLVELDTLAQDGLRVRASAGAASFRRKPTLEEALTQAPERIEALRVELESDPTASSRRQEKAQRRAARERAERIQAALGRLPELEAKKKPGQKDQARASTTDPEATVMKMPDGGFRPAYNLQFATTVGTQVIAGVAVDPRGSDQGQMSVMAGQVQQRYEQGPGAMLVDGGFVSHEEIEAVSAPAVGCTVYAPVPQPKDPQVDRHAPKPSDSPAVAEWRQRMATDQAKAIYKGRAATAECVNAQARGRGLVQVLVRGVAEVRTIGLWSALAHNLMRTVQLRAARCRIARGAVRAEAAGAV